MLRRASRICAAGASLLAAAAMVVVAAGCGQASTPSAHTTPKAASAPHTASAYPATAKAPASAPAAKPATLTKVQFTLDFLPNGYHGPLVDAIDNGYFKQAGLNVHMVAGKGSLTTVEQVATGAATFGFADIGAASKVIAKGAHIKSVMTVTQTSPLCIITRASAHVTSPAQLKGQSFAITPGGIDSYMLPAFLAATHVPKSALKIISVAPAEKLSTFINRKVSALVGFANYEIPALEAKGIKLNQMCYANYGLNALEDSIFASDATISGHPGMVKGFVAAVSKGYAYAAQHPNKTIANTIKFFGAAAAFNAALGKAELHADLIREHTAATKGKPLGWVARSDMASSLAIFKKYLGLKTNLPPSAFYTNQFIPSAG